jgi:hypothetical protein
MLGHEVLARLSVVLGEEPKPHAEEDDDKLKQVSRMAR